MQAGYLLLLQSRSNGLGWLTTVVTATVFSQPLQDLIIVHSNWAGHVGDNSIFISEVTLKSPSRDQNLASIKAQTPLTNMGSPQEPSKFEGGTDFDWQNCLAHRPEYSASFYDVIWDYHRSHSNAWTLAHDVGTGLAKSLKCLPVDSKT